MTRLVYDGGEVRLADSLLIYESPFRTGTNLLVLPDLCTFVLRHSPCIHPPNNSPIDVLSLVFSVLCTFTRAVAKYTFDPSFCGDFISLASEYKACHLDSANERWYSTRARISDQHSAAITRGVHHWEVQIDCSRNGLIFIGVCTDLQDRNRWIGCDAHGWGYLGTKQLWAGGQVVSTTFGEEFRSGDIIGATLDMDARTLSFRKNGRSLGKAFSNLPDRLYPAFSLYTSGDRISAVHVNGRREYPYADRSDLIALKTYRGNCVELDISRKACAPFNLFPGDAVHDSAIDSDAVVVGVGIAPERFKNFIFLWHKQRPGVGGWSLGDAPARIQLRERADQDKPVKQVLAAVLADEHCRWVDVPQVPVFHAPHAHAGFFAGGSAPRGHPRHPHDNGGDPSGGGDDEEQDQQELEEFPEDEDEEEHYDGGGDGGGSDESDHE